MAKCGWYLISEIGCSSVFRMQNPGLNYEGHSRNTQTSQEYVLQSDSLVRAQWKSEETEEDEGCTEHCHNRGDWQQRHRDENEWLRHKRNDSVQKRYSYLTPFYDWPSSHQCKHNCVQHQWYRISKCVQLQIGDPSFKQLDTSGGSGVTNGVRRCVSLLVSSSSFSKVFSSSRFNNVSFSLTTAILSKN